MYAPGSYSMNISTERKVISLRHAGARVPQIPNTPLGAERPKESTHVHRQRLRLLQGGEVAPAGHRRPPLDVQDLLGHRAWGPHALPRKVEIGRWHVDARAGGHGPVAVTGRIVGPEGGVDGAGGPVEHHSRQQLVLGKAPLDLPTAIAPTPELLDDPGGQADGGVGQTVRERLGFGPLDPLVSCLFREPVLQLLEVVPLLVCWTLWTFDLAECSSDKVEVNPVQMLGMRGSQP